MGPGKFSKQGGNQWTLSGPEPRLVLNSRVRISDFKIYRKQLSSRATKVTTGLAFKWKFISVIQSSMSVSCRFIPRRPPTLLPVTRDPRHEVTRVAPVPSRATTLGVRLVEHARERWRVDPPSAKATAVARCRIMTRSIKQRIPVIIDLSAEHTLMRTGALSEGIQIRNLGVQGAIQGAGMAWRPGKNISGPSESER